jgi:hypothetical protein
MEDVLQQGFRPLPLHPDGAATHRLKSGLRCCLRGLQHSAAQKPTNRASQLKREARAEPNGNRDDRFGPIWQMVHGVVPRHTDKSPSCSRLGYWIVDYGGRPASTAEVGSSRVGRGSAFISAELQRGLATSRFRRYPVRVPQFAKPGPADNASRQQHEQGAEHNADRDD